MLLAEIFAILMVTAVIVALMAGYPVALTLAGVSLASALLGDVAIIAAALLLMASAGRFVRTRFERDLRYQSLRHGWTLQLRASLLALLGHPMVGGDPVVGFLFGFKFSEEVRCLVRPRDFDAPIAR